MSICWFVCNLECVFLFVGFEFKEVYFLFVGINEFLNEFLNDYFNFLLEIKKKVIICKS